MTTTSQNSSANSSSEQLIIEVLPDRRIMHLGAWDFTIWNDREDDEPLVRDTDLGKRLGFVDPRMIRKLIKNHKIAGNINPYEVMCAAEITGGRPARECWLTEEDALFITSKCGTAAATAQTKEMIRVFMLARRGLLGQQSVPGISVAMFAEFVASNTDAMNGISQSLVRVTETMASMQVQVMRLHERVERADERGGLFGRVKARLYLDEIKAIAALYWPDPKGQKKERAGCRVKIEQAGRAAVGIGPGQPWEDARSSRESDVKLCLNGLRLAAELDPVARRRRELFATPPLFKQN